MTSDNISKGVNAHIREYLDYYCHLSNPKFAVLLKGPWGSGKTWLIKDFIKDFGQKNFLYISLYGMQTLEAVEREFLRQLHPVLGSTGATFLAKSILQVGIKAKLDLKIEDIPESFKSAHERILIFDDLERCHANTDHVLGYINSFIEHQSARVIIVANEQELYRVNENQSQECKHPYQLIKEKTIGKTFEIKFSLQEIIESLIEDLYQSNVIKNKEIKDLVKNQIQTIETVYRYTEHKNIRVLRKIILDLDRIWASLPVNVIQKEEAIQEFFELLIIFLIEISEGRIDPTDIDNIRSSYKPETKIHKLIEKYSFIRKLLSRGYNLFPIDRWWVEFFDKGVINEELLEQSIKNSPYFRDENTESWLKLYQYKTLTDEKFTEALVDIENQFFEGKIDNPKVVIHVFGILLELITLTLSQASFAALEDAMNSYIK